MIANEWKFIGKNRLILISVLAIMIIPFLYSIFFLKSVWNPYGETQHLPVAVVNNDQPVKYQGQTMNVGDQAIKSLKKDHQLGWRFVSEKKAKQGLKDKKYYTIVTFPKDTSKNAASVLSKNPKKMDIQYETNGSLNYIGEVISQIGATGLNEKIRQTIIKAYADATFQQVKKVGKGMNTAAKGAKTLSKGQKTLGTGIDTYTAYVSQVNDGVQTMKMSVGPLSSGVGKLADGGKTLNNGLQTLNGSTGQLAGGVNQLANGSNQLVSGSGQVASGVRSYTGAVGTLNSGIQTLNGQTGALAGGVGQLANGGNTLNSGLQTLNGKTSAIAGGVGQLTSGSNALNNGLQTLNGKTADLANGASQLSSGANQVNNGVQQYTNAVSQLNTGLSQISQNNGSITAGLNNIKNSSAELSELPTMLTAMQAVHDQTPGLQKNMQDLQSQMGALDKLSELQKSLAGMNLDGVNTDAATKGLQAAQDNAGAANSSFDKIAADINGTNLSDADKQTAINAVQGDIAAGKKSALTAQAAAKGVSDGLGGMTATLAQIKPALSQLSGFDAASLSSTANSTFAQANTLLNTAGSLTSQDTINKLKNLAAQTADMSKQLDGIQTYVDSVGKASAGASQLNSQSGALVSGTSQLSNGLTQLNGQVPALTGGISQLADGSQKLNGGLGQLNGQIPALTGGVSQLANGSQQLAGGLNQLNGSVPALTNDVAQLANGSSQIAGNSAALVSGADQVSAGNSQLNGGIGQLNAQVPQLVSGVQQLANGSYQLSGGLDQLNSQIPALTDGVNQLADGTSQLNSNSPALKDGTKKLVTGSVKLSDALGKGADQVNAMPLTSKTSDMFSAPTKLTHKSYSKVANYGHALAPYVLSVALYVGAIVFNFAYPIRKVSMSGQSATAWFFSKTTIGLVVAVVQAVAETGLMMLFGLSADHPGQMFAVSISFSIASMFLVMFLSMLLDNPGRFIAMVLLMLQLGGSGGTFPMQVTNGFYNAIHPYLPMTYSILGLRQGLTSGLGNDTVTQAVGLLLLMAVIFAVLLWLSMLLLQRMHLQGFSQLDDNQKLQDVEK
ncbi:YhgE/Pip domain-containing protein [Furfurilactobacillus milii]|uniref:DUF3533 domain-containing protein n=1 Tax=Furfurilactobacillus milii TaxID=2888272 RepID=A0A6N9I421_9LACO|nr:YhgE/Pip domain-containing protein [Furfurilactobacillus milii]MYV17715.1 DUF3533 domain-containing protein [Furfurilactobacillus milii]